mgnify:CR=1 FL=1
MKVGNMMSKIDLTRFTDKKDNYELIVNRDEAIKKALMNARQGDLVFVLGKGLEKYQLTKGKNVSRPNDVESCKKVLKQMEKFDLLYML